MKVSKEVIHREIAGEHILIPVGATALRVHGMMTLTESGQLLFERLQEGCSEDELVDAILKEYDIDRETADVDVKAFLAKLDAVGLLEK